MKTFSAPDGWVVTLTDAQFDWLTRLVEAGGSAPPPRGRRVLKNLEAKGLATFVEGIWSPTTKGCEVIAGLVPTSGQNVNSRLLRALRWWSGADDGLIPVVHLNALEEAGFLVFSDFHQEYELNAAGREAMTNAGFATCLKGTESDVDAV